MSDSTIHLSEAAPDAPASADFALIIEFKKGAGSPQRVFQAADAMIRALQHLDHVLCSSVDNSIQPLMVLEDVKEGSIKIWLRNKLAATDDQAIKKLEWRELIGAYLVDAKYAYIRWANKGEPTASLSDLSHELRAIAAKTDVLYLPAYSPPSVVELAETTREVDAAKAFLEEGDHMSYAPATTDRPPLEFALSVRWSPEELADLSIKESVKFDNMPMTLIVKRPDYLGAAKWEFRHGKTTVVAKIEDTPWLARFQGRQVDVRPGDALKCRVNLVRGYGFDNELINETISITTVEDVLPDLTQQLMLPGDSGN